MATPSQALFHIFIQPLLRPPRHISIRRQAPICLRNHLPTPPRLAPSLTTHRHNTGRAHGYRPTSTSTPKKHISLSDTFILDERIAAPSAHLVDADGKLGDLTPLHQLLRDINREKNHLRKVAQGPDGAPVVKLVSKAALKLEVDARAAARAVAKSDDRMTKQVELTWGIAGNDLGYRMARIENFLKEGRLVEVLIVPKKRGRKATKEEITELMRSVRDSIKALEGTEEWKPMEGPLGGQVVMYLRNEGQKAVAVEERKAKKVENAAEKLERKNKEKEENREKNERRAQRRQEEEKEREKQRLALIQ